MLFLCTLSPLTLIGKDECHESWQNFTVVENTICAGENSGPSACKGKKFSDKNLEIIDEIDELK